MKNSDYWKKRFTVLEAAAHSYGQHTYSQVEAAFMQAQRDIQGEIDRWYARFAANNNVTLTDAKKMLSSKELAELKWDVNQYIQFGRENAMNKQWMKQLENASARFHITRLEALQLRTQQAMEVAFGNQLDHVDKMARHILTEDYYHSIFEVQKGFNIGWNIGQVDEKELNKLVVKPWAADGKNFSDRIWQQKQNMIGQLYQELTRTLVQGKSPDSAIKHLKQFVDSKFKNARYAASRLVMTEQAYFHSVSQAEAFKEIDVEEFEIIATLDDHTSEICQELDGKHYPMKEYEAGVTAPPFHPNCRCVTAPYFEDNYSGMRAARDKDGKTYYVPDDMTYEKWKKSFVDEQTGDQTNGLTPAPKSGTINSGLMKEQIDKLDKLKQSGMTEDDYNKYLEIINGHENPDIIKLYKEYADKISSVTQTAGGVYNASSNSLKFDYPAYSDMNRYGTLAHEYGHFFDAKAQFDNLHFTEIEAVRDLSGLQHSFTNVASSSDEFLAAIRKDKQHIKGILTAEAKADLLAHNASSGVQDAIDGLFPKSRLAWGHGEKYYNRKYANIEFMDKFTVPTPDNPLRKKKLQQLYKDLGFDASNQEKVKTICRQYEAASEAWANIMKAEVCGGAELEYVKKYLPNSYKAMLDILKGVK